MSRDQRDNAVAASPDSVHPIGQAISHSVNHGERPGARSRDFCPAVGVVWARGANWSACPFISLSPDRSPLRFFRPPSTSATVIVAHISACMFRALTVADRIRPASTCFALRARKDSADPPGIVAVGVIQLDGKRKESLANMRKAALFRAE